MQRCTNCRRVNLDNSPGGETDRMIGRTVMFEDKIAIIAGSHCIAFQPDLRHYDIIYLDGKDLHPVAGLPFSEFTLLYREEARSAFRRIIWRLYMKGVGPNREEKVPMTGRALT